MKRIGVISTAVLFVLLGTAALACIQQDPQGEKQNDSEKEAKSEQQQDEKHAHAKEDQRQLQKKAVAKAKAARRERAGTARARDAAKARKPGQAEAYCATAAGSAKTEAAARN